MKDYKNYSAEDFAQDEQFIDWVNDQKNGQYWITFIEQHPDQAEEIRLASQMVQSLIPFQEKISEETKQHIWASVEKQAGTVKRKRQLRVYAYAASLIVLLGIGSVYLYTEQKMDPNEIAIEELSNIKINPGESTQLILADGNTVDLTTKKSVVEYDQAGKTIRINSNSIVKQAEPVASKTKGLNQIVVPYGKVSQITLCDGTKVWLNSGSRLVFPPAFEKKKREVVLIGEAFFDVARNETSPFIVRTKEYNIRVVGTSFNVSSYGDDNFAETVLVEGKVKLYLDNQSKNQYEILPGNKAVYSSETNNFRIEKVQVNLYTSWKDGYWECQNTPLVSLVNKLSRHYNYKIEINDTEIKRLTFSGKLIQEENINHVLDKMVLASELKYTYQDDMIVIEKIK